MRNTYRVPKKQWNRWSSQAKEMFNVTYRLIKENAEHLYPPGRCNLIPKELSVLAWNVAWLTAENFDNITGQ